MADDELELTDVEIEAAKQLVHLSESETTAVSATSSSASCGGSVSFNCAEKHNRNIGDNASKKRKIRKDKNQDRKMKTRKEFNQFDDDDDGEEGICSWMRSKRYRFVVDIYKFTKPFN